MTIVVVIGLDGATWNLLMPWIKKDELTTLKKLIDEGTYGYLRSSNPPITFPAWKCYSTGKNPGKLGVYSFVGLDKENRDMKVYTGRDFKEKEIWDYLNDNGIKSCVINMPGTYPPSKNAIMISGIPITGSNYAYPPEIREELSKIGYRVNPRIYPGTKNNKQEHEHLKELISSRFEIADKIRNKYKIDFWHVTIFYIDKIQHAYFKNKSVLKDYWQFIDRKIGEFLEGFDEDVNLFLMSDHGATEIKNTFYLNEFLFEKGYLQLKLKNRQSKFNTTRITIKLLDKLRKRPFLYANLKEIFEKFTPESIKNNISVKSMGKRKAKFLSKIDWENSDFVDIGMGFGLIYKLNGEEGDVQKLKEELERVKDPLTGEKVAEVFLKDEIYKGDLKDAPDIVVIPNSNTMITEVIRDAPTVWGPTPNDWEGMHEKEGIFLAHGPDIREGMEIKGVKILDLAPTILYMFGVPIPTDMDGRVLKEIFKEDSELAKRPVIYREVVSEKEEIKEKIKKMKAMSKI